MTVKCPEVVSGLSHYHHEPKEYYSTDDLKEQDLKKEFKVLAEEFTEYVEHLKSGKVVGSAKCIASIEDTDLGLKKCVNPFLMNKFQQIKGEDPVWESEVGWKLVLTYFIQF